MKNVETNVNAETPFARQTAAVTAAVQQAVNQALLEHKQSGDPIVVCENGQVRWIPADEIEIPPLPQ